MKESKVQEVENGVISGEVTPKKDDSLNQEQALNILVQAVRLANKRGAYELEETELILKAVKVFTVK